MNSFDKQLIEKYVPLDKRKEAFILLNSGYPIQYIIGNVDFYGCEIKVNEDVLIPRFETEYLVDDLIKLLKEKNFINPAILDIGTGSGCISIALAKNIESSVSAIEISLKALEVAKENASLNKVSINFMRGDIENYETSKKYDVIVSNPPYVPLGSDVDPKTHYEPQNAIFAKDEGLYYYKVILEKSVRILNEKNIIAFEIGHNQADKIMTLAKNYYPNSIVISKNDLNNFNRYIYIINE